MFSEFRSFTPECCSMATFLDRYANITHKTKEIFLARARAGKALRSIPTIKDAFAKLIKEQIKSSKVNLIIDNLPKYGIRKCDDCPEDITCRSIYDTMSDFGTVRDAVVFNNQAYIWFDEIEDAYNTHTLINQMKMGDNIITTYVVN